MQVLLLLKKIQTNINKKLMKNSDHILKVGRVRSVQGRKVHVLVDKRKNTSHLLLNGDVIKNVAVGSYIKIAKGFNEIIGKIEGESIEEDKVYMNKEYGNTNDKIKRELIVSLVGFIENGKFYQGIKDLPLIENECYLLRRNEFDIVHKFIKEEDADESIKVGVLASETGVPIELGVDNLFASHIGIFGNTGSGKSYTLAKLYHELFRKYKNEEKFKENAKFILIDFNGEYVNPNQDKGENDYPDIIVEKDFKSEYYLSDDRRFPISSETIENLEILSIFLDATEKTQKPFLDSVLKYSIFKDETFEFGKFISEYIVDFGLKKNDADLKAILLDLFNDLYDVILNKENLLAAKNILSENLFFNPNDKSKSFYTFNGNTKEYNEKNLEEKVIQPLKDNIEILKLDEDNSLNPLLSKIILKYYRDLLTGYVQKEFVYHVVKRAKKIFHSLNKYIIIKEETITENLIIVSIKNVSESTIKKSLPLVISKEFYEKHKKIGDRSKYLNIIIDEAHNILSSTSNRESETWKDYRLETFEEIIKEGRKFGVFLTIASQRPFDISHTIISQLHNYFLHRLINNKDIEAIEKTVSYLDKVSFESIPILPIGNCVLAGLSAQLPVVVKIDKIEDEKEGDIYIKRYSPYNETIRLTDNWK